MLMKTDGSIATYESTINGEGGRLTLKCNDEDTLEVVSLQIYVNLEKCKKKV